MSDDLISRQAAVDALKNDMASLDHIIKGMSAYDVRLDAYVLQRNQVNYDIFTLNNLDTAQPELCEDAVSRKAVIDMMDEWKEACADSGHKETASDIMLIRKDFIELPPVTPKQRTGHWHITDAYPHNVYCSECHKRFAQTHWAVWEDGSLPRNFCPNCGVKMEGDAE